LVTNCDAASYDCPCDCGGSIVLGGIDPVIGIEPKGIEPGGIEPGGIERIEPGSIEPVGSIDWLPGIIVLPKLAGRFIEPGIVELYWGGAFIEPGGIVR